MVSPSSHYTVLRALLMSCWQDSSPGQILWFQGSKVPPLGTIPGPLVTVASVCEEVPKLEQHPPFCIVKLFLGIHHAEASSDAPCL